MRRSGSLFAAVALLVVAGCATAPSDPAALSVYKANNDPLEPFNRRIFALNNAIDRSLLKPIAKGYVRLLPQPVRDGLRNAVLNMHEPVVFANNVLQGRFGRAGITAGRFALDSTFGLVGLVDVGRREGLSRQVGDLGQTFHAWGFPEGPYLVLPLFGPSNPRDAIGFGGEVFLDPFRYVTSNDDFPKSATYAPGIIGGIDERSRNIETLDAIEKDAIDYYASLRSLFRQNRAAQLTGDASTAAPAMEGLYDDPGSVAPAK
jgi:phospholipid-binding lipoprotein MlaA